MTLSVSVNASLTTHILMFRWFVSILVVAFDICFNILGGGRHLGMVICHSVNAGSVVGTLIGDGDTRLPYEKKLFELFVLTGSGTQKLSA